MLPALHRRLLNQATTHGTGEILRQMPVEHSPELEQAIHQGVRQAVLYYALGLDSWDQPRRPIDPVRKIQA
jgi:hypothetical protein